MILNSHEEFYKAIKVIQDYFDYFFNKLKNEYHYKDGTKISIRDVFTYYLLYTKFGATQEDVVNIFKDKMKINITRQAFIKRFKEIDQDIFYKFFTGLKKILCKNMSGKPNVFAVDGTYINLYDRDEDNKLGYKKKCILGLVNTTTNMPYDFFTSQDDSTSEISLFNNYLNKETFSKNDIIVTDLLYFSNNLYIKFIEKSLNFVCRLKISSKLLVNYKLNLHVNDNNFNKYDYDYIYNGKTIRVVTYIKGKNIFHIATSLAREKYSINDIASMYKKRWNSEIMFKHIKKTTTLDKIYNIERKTIDVKIYFSFIINMISTYLINTYYHTTDTSNKKVNVSNFTKVFYDRLLYDLTHKLISLKDVYEIYNIIIILYISRDYEVSFIRRSIMPYTKWHYKCKFKEIQ